MTALTPETPTTPVAVPGRRCKEKPTTSPKEKASASRNEEPASSKSAQPSSPLDDEEEEGPLPGSRPQPPETPQDASPKTPAEEGPATEAEDEQKQVYDLLSWRESLGKPLKQMRLALLRDYFEPGLSRDQLKQEFRFQIHTSTGRAIHRLFGRQITAIDYYETRIGNQAAREVGLSSLEEMSKPGGVVDLTDKAGKFQRAEKLLTTAIAEHDSAVQRGLREGLIWDNKFRKPLTRALVNLRLGEVDQLVKKQQYVPAQMKCDRLSGEVTGNHPQLADLRRRYEIIFRARATATLATTEPTDKKYAAVRDLLDELTDRLDGELGPIGKEFQDGLIAKAGRLVDEAEKLRESAPSKAIELLDQAAEIWPSLSRLGELRRRIGYPVLYCAYTQLPRNLSPVTAHMAHRISNATWAAVSCQLSAVSYQPEPPQKSAVFSG